MQQSVVHKKPHRGAHDGLEWIRAQFSLRGAYKRLCERQYEESRPIIRRQRVPIKMRFFGWLLLQRRLMTRLVYKQSYPEIPTSCAQCSSGEEDCAFFFRMPFCQDAMELTHHSEGRHNLKDILLGLNSEDWQQEEGGEGLHICGALGNMAASE